MDPVTLLLLSIAGAAVFDALEDPGEMSEYYPKTAKHEMEEYQGWVLMEGDGVAWLVEPGEAVWIDSRYLRPISGNIFDADKLAAIAGTIQKGGGNQRYVFMAPYGQVQRIGPSEVAESIRYTEDDPGRPFTTGDEDLDAWLADPEQWLADNGWDDDSRAELQAEKEAELQEAVRKNRGDLGQWTATIRDGNHRAFGAALGGEEAVAVRLYDNDVQDLKEGIRRGRFHLPWQADLIEKAVEDTGEPADWMQTSKPKWSEAELSDFMLEVRKDLIRRGTDFPPKATGRQIDLLIDAFEAGETPRVAAGKLLGVLRRDVRA